jgi:coenzyme F420-reducing hydrogenase beta subunit
LYCYDKLNNLSDISFGDCYVEGKANKDGNSNIIIRTRKGEQTLKKFSHLFYSETEVFKKIVKSQNVYLKAKKLEYNKSLYEIKRIGMKDFLFINSKMILARFYLRRGQKYSSFILFHFYILKFYKYLISHLKTRN